jgi:hypothetical protein
MEYTIKKIEENQFELLVPLMQDCFGMDVKVDYFHWKYMKNPAGIVEGYYAIHNESKEVAAYYGVIPQYFEINGKLQKWFQSCDTMTHSQHRRKGLFKLLALHCYQELEKTNQLMIIGSGGSESTPGFLNFGWKELFTIRNYYFPSFLTKIFLGSNYKEITTLNLTSEVERILNFKSAKSNINLGLNTTTYLWRLSNPLRDYRIVGKKNKTGELVSFAVYYIEKNKAILLDLEFKSPKELHSLLKRINLTEKNSGFLYFGQVESVTTKMLTSNFFFSNPFKKGPLSQRTPFIIYISKKLDLSFFEQKNHWNITPIYHDSI